MAIKRRTLDDIEPDTSEEVSFESIDTTATPVMIAEDRLAAYVAGNRGTTPHPKDVDPASLLRAIQYNPNEHLDFGPIEGFYRNRVRSPLTGIRAFCVMCMDGPRKANDCETVTCPLWPFRKGSNAYYGKK